jgi:hypothetical protein
MRHMDLAVLAVDEVEKFEYELEEVAMAPDMQRRYMVIPADTKLDKKEVFFSYLEAMSAVNLKEALHQKVLDAYGF